MSKMTSLERTFIELAREWLGEEMLTGGSRRCLFTTALTAWLMIAQKLIPRGTLSKVVHLLKGGMLREDTCRMMVGRRIDVLSVGSGTGGLSRARSRLKMEVVEELSDLIYEEATRETSGTGRWKGRAIYIQDGTTIPVQNTAELRRRYEPCQNERGERTPAVRVVVVHNLVSGLAVRPEFDSLRVSEQELARRMYERLEPASILLGDENFGVFSSVYWALRGGHDVVARLQGKRAQKILGRTVPPSCDERVIWTPSHRDRGTNPNIPEDAMIAGRLLSVQLHAPGYRPTPFLFFTTDMDLSIEDVLELYRMRVRVETDIRHLKGNFRLDVLMTKSVAMVAKELLLGVAAYNLLRVCIHRGAQAIGVEPRRVSLSRASDLLHSLAALYLRDPTKEMQKKIQALFLRDLKQSLLPNRKKARVEPRKLVRSSARRFQTLLTSRSEERTAILKEGLGK